MIALLENYGDVRDTLPASLHRPSEETPPWIDEPFSMGYVHATIELSNPRQPQLHPMEVQALADTGALMLCIPEHVVVQLQLEQESLREVTVADGRVMQVPYVGPVRVAYQGRSCFVGALVLGDSVWLGAVPMEDMDLIVHPARQRLEPDPRSPNIPHALVKASEG